MKQKIVSLLLLCGFAVSVGHFTYRTWQPQSAPEYTIGGQLRPMQWRPAEHPPKNIYFRRMWYLTQQPQHAWLRVVGHDKFDVIINEQRVDISARAHHRTAVGILADITSYLQVGRNVIAIAAGQQTLNRPPAIAIDGAYHLVSGQVRSLADPATWRVFDSYERRDNFWWAKDFNDQHWPRPHVAEPTFLRAQVSVPPQSVTKPTAAAWITPPADQRGNAAVRTTFDVPMRPHSSWLRVATTGPYRLAVNGVVIAGDQQELAKPPPYIPVIATYDISRVVRSGKNVVALMLSTGSEAPHVRADLEVRDRSGQTVSRQTDGNWYGAAGTPVGWCALRGDAAAIWEPCRVEDGEVGLKPWQLKRIQADVVPSASARIKAAALEATLMLLCGLAAWLGCLTVSRSGQQLAGSSGARLPRMLPYVALLVPAVAAALGTLTTYDIALGVGDVYTPQWLVALWGTLIVQWLFILMLSVDARSLAPSRWSRRGKQWVVALTLIVLCSVGLWLRVRNILAEPVHHDEVGAYYFSLGVLAYGFPGGQIHPDMPFGWCATSELVYFPMAPFALLLENPLLALRVPAVCWSMATMLLLYYVGRKLFTPIEGLLAAAVFALSPYAVGMANFGRYFSQLQFCALLTVYFFWQTIRGDGPINRTALWITAVSFCVMFLSWEGSALIAPGMAVAALIQRRKRLKSVFLCPSIYAAIVLVALVVVAQGAHRTFQQTERMSFGSGISNMSLMPMWRYVVFQPSFYFLETSWMEDGLLPMIGLIGALVLAMNYRYQQPLRVLLIILMGNCGLMMALLPLRSGRYAYHLTPLLILCSCAALVAAGRAVARLGYGAAAPRWTLRYARGAVAVAVAGLLVVGSGQWVHTSELEDFKTRAYPAGFLRFPDWEGPMRYLRGHMQEDDIVITFYPHAVNFTLLSNQDQPIRLDSQAQHYWLQSTLIVQSTLDDVRTVPLDRRSGVTMIPDLEYLQQLFADHDRIWYCTVRSAQTRVNDREVSAYIRQHMDVVFEDFRTTVMFRDKNHRPAGVRLEEEEQSQSAHQWYLR